MVVTAGILDNPEDFNFDITAAAKGNVLTTTVG
jgi:hypothetical protein